MTKPILSVLIDTHNHERYIEQAVVSAIEQDLPAPDYEILVVDDGSTDRTAEIVRKFAPRVKLLSKKNGGQASAFNVGIQEASGQILAFLDGDDWWAKGKLTAAAGVLDRSNEIAAVAHGYYDVSEQNGEVNPCAPGQAMLLNLATPDAAREAFQAWDFLRTSALTVRKQTVHRVMPIPEVLVFSADSPIAMASMAMGVYVLPEPLCYYRRHSGNLYAVDPKNAAKTRRKWEMDEVMFEVLDPLLLRLGVRPESVAALLYPHWVLVSRFGLGMFGGSPVKTFRTEMRAFRLECTNPALSYRLYKYLVVGSATLLLPARHFYKVRNWYSRRNLGRIRELFFKGGQGLPGPSVKGSNPASKPSE